MSLQNLEEPITPFFKEENESYPFWIELEANDPVLLVNVRVNLGRNWVSDFYFPHHSTWYGDRNEDVRFSYRSKELQIRLC